MRVCLGGGYRRLLIASVYSTVRFQPPRGQCPGLNANFSAFVGKYESHTRVHTGEKPFECDVCHQRYSTKSNLTVHRKKHSADTEVPKKEHRCPRCDKLHASKKTLAKHVKRQVSPRVRPVTRCASPGSAWQARDACGELAGVHCHLSAPRGP